MDQTGELEMKNWVFWQPKAILTRQEQQFMLNEQFWSMIIEGEIYRILFSWQVLTFGKHVWHKRERVEMSDNV